MWPWSTDDSPSSVVALRLGLLLHDLVCCNEKCWCWSAGVCYLVMLELVCRFLSLDVRTDTAGLLQVGLAAASSSHCTCMVVRRLEVFLWRHSEISLKRAGYDFRELALKRVVWESFGDWLETGFSCGESAAVIGCILCWLLGEAQIPLLSACMSTSDHLVIDHCVYIEVTGSIFYGLCGGISVLPNAGSLSFKYK